MGRGQGGQLTGFRGVYLGNLLEGSAMGSRAVEPRDNQTSIHIQQKTSAAGGPGALRAGRVNEPMNPARKGSGRRWARPATRPCAATEPRVGPVLPPARSTRCLLEALAGTKGGAIHLAAGRGRAGIDQVCGGDHAQLRRAPDSRAPSRGRCAGHCSIRCDAVFTPGLSAASCAIRTSWPASWRDRTGSRAGGWYSGRE